MKMIDGVLLFAFASVQTYKAGAVFVMGNIVKTEAKIITGDSNVMQTSKNYSTQTTTLEV